MLILLLWVFAPSIKGTPAKVFSICSNAFAYHAFVDQYEHAGSIFVACGGKLNAFPQICRERVRTAGKK